MPSIRPPKYVLAVCKRLESHGYKAFLVGGCVRDCVMGRRPGDWDVCTDALPSEVAAIFPNNRPTGIKHGTVTVLERGSNVEITTFRSDGEYKDHRRPENVSFITDLTSDLQRRDFTVNSIALSLNGIIFDPFSGMADIEKKIIRCVGDPNKRFAEDALRMFRAVRFSATLGFKIEEQTLVAIENNAYLATSLASERVCSETEKILLSGAPQYFEFLIHSGLMSEYVRNNTISIDLSPLAQLPKNRAQRWAALCALLCRYKIISNSEDFLKRLRLDSATVSNASCGCDSALAGAPKNKLEWKRLLAKKGVACGNCTAAASQVLGGRKTIRQLQTVISSGDCYSLKRLNIDGNDLLELGILGPALGNTLSALLDYVLEHPDENVHDILLDRAKSMI